MKSHYIGEVINNLTILDKKNEDGRVFYYCKCSYCNKKKWIRTDVLKSAKSCGCLREEKIKENAHKLYKGHLDKNIKDHTNIAIISKDKPNSRNTSGHKGVYWDKSRQQWQAYIYFKNKRQFLGRFEKIEKAIEVREKAEEEIHKNFLEKLK